MQDLQGNLGNEERKFYLLTKAAQICDIDFAGYRSAKANDKVFHSAARITDQDLRGNAINFFKEKAADVASLKNTYGRGFTPNLHSL